MARVLVIGSGGREHAICDKFSKSKKVEKVFVAPGNPGMRDVAEPVNISDYEELSQFALDNKVDLTFVGPEVALCDGIVDIFMAKGLKIFGPSKMAARLEGSKIFSKNIMKKYGIPTAKYETFIDYNKALAYLETQKMPLVLKADGLASGKGVVIATSLEEAKESLKSMMLDGAFNKAGTSLVIEEFLEGEEFSLLAFVSGNKIYPMQLAQDHKRAFDNDRGLNTGGMGAYTPLNHIDSKYYQEALDKVMYPVVKAMALEGCPFNGVLYGGMMVTSEGVKTIEFNVRFGDPETEVILSALENDFYDLILDVMDEKDLELKFSKKTYCGVVLASKGYPEEFEKGFEIKGLDKVKKVYHMGTSIKDNKIVTSGGRVLFVIGEGDDLDQARKDAYDNVSKIECENLFYRTDIGSKGLKK